MALALAPLAPARAQSCGEIRDTEILFDFATQTNEKWTLQVFDALGNVIEPEQSNASSVPISTGVGEGCALRVDTNGADDYANYTYLTDSTYVFVLSGSMGSVTRFTYDGLCNILGVHSFQCPNMPDGSGDTDLLLVFEELPEGERWRFSPSVLWGQGGGQDRYMDEFSTMSTGVLPYQFDHVCSPFDSVPFDCPGTPHEDWRLFPTPQDNLPVPIQSPTFRFSDDADVTLPASRAYRWEDAGLRLEFGQGRRLVVEGDLEADGVTFTEAVAGQGWGGIAFEPGSSGTIENSVVERVSSYGGASVHITNASPTFRGTRVADEAGGTTDGFYITGSSAFPVLDNNVITGLSSDGIVLSTGADARLIRNTIEENGGDGLIASSSGTKAFLSPPYGSTPVANYARYVRQRHPD